MLKFNTLLSECGVDPKDVQLARHQDVGPNGVTPYSLLTTAPGEFDCYQMLQGRRVFRGKFVAAFVAAPGNQTLFANLYRVESEARNNTKMRCPIRLKEFEPDQVFVYALSRDARLEDFSQRLTIHWGDGYRSWVQRAHRQNKNVAEIRSQVKDEPFPGYDTFLIILGDLQNTYPSWQENLFSQKGIYLLTFSDGQQYVGSATGLGGFWQRWQDYIKTGHGGNVALKMRDARLAQVCILETARMSDKRKDILDLEYLWQRKLGTRTERLGDGDDRPLDA